MYKLLLALTVLFWNIPSEGRAQTALWSDYVSIYLDAGFTTGIFDAGGTLDSAAVDLIRQAAVRDYPFGGSMFDGNYVWRVQLAYRPAESQWMTFLGLGERKVYRFNRQLGAAEVRLRNATVGGEVFLGFPVDPFNLFARGGFTFNKFDGAMQAPSPVGYTTYAFRNEFRLGVDLEAGLRWNLVQGEGPLSLESSIALAAPTILRASGAASGDAGADWIDTHLNDGGLSVSGETGECFIGFVAWHIGIRVSFALANGGSSLVPAP